MGNYIYEIFAYCEQYDLPDLTIALAMMIPENPIPEGIEYRDICEFIGKHYKQLVKAYKKKDAEYFSEVVNELLGGNI